MKLMNLQKYKDTYKSEIRMQICWAKIANDTAVDTIKLDRIDDVAALHTAWYFPQVDGGTDYLDSEKRNLKVGEVAGNLGMVAAHEEDIKCWLQELCSSNNSPLVFPAYRLPDDEYLLLDGNHRVVAAVVVEKLPITLHVLRGNISKEILPDLWRWEATKD